MRSPKGQRYVSRAEDFEQYRKRLKFLPCPHCRAVGHLVRHGYLRGYGAKGHEKIRRGWRIFCSNRRRRRGCGRTHSILLAEFAPRFLVTADPLFRFIHAVRQGLTRKAAWERLLVPWALQTGYRLWQRLCRRQSPLRSLLCRQIPPPACRSQNPVFQLIDHLSLAFPKTTGPIAAFHLHFQHPFL
jgi:hypothetical protein